MHRILCIAVAAVATAVGSLPVAGAEADNGRPLLPLSEVEPGQRGVGLSVFAGYEPEEFEVEVLGVWRNLRPGTSYILARLSGRGLEESGVIAGMSGSPVYVDGRLAGAVAFAWPFSQEPIAGITPIETMREQVGGERPRLAGAAAIAEPPLPTEWPAELAGLAPPPARSRPDRSFLVERLAALRPRAVAEASSGIQWVASGFGDASRSLLSEAVGPVAQAGSSASPPAGELVPGSAVAGVLVDGDLFLAASGTVTDRVGDRVLAFGHPFLGLGEVDFPMARAEVLTVVSSRYSSFKITNLGPIVGAFDSDHMVGIGGRLGAEARMVPVEVNVAGLRPERIAARIVHEAAVSPSLLATVIVGALEASADTMSGQSVDLDLLLRLGSDGDLRVRQSFEGPDASLQAAVHAFQFAAYLLQNPHREVRIEGVQVTVTPSAEPRTARLVAAHASRAVVRPGERLALNLDLVAYRGEPFRRSLELAVPTGVPDGRYSLLVGDGMSIDAARLALQKSAPVNLRQALDLLGSLHSRRELLVLGIFPSPGLAVAGEVLPLLPGSVRSLWSAGATGSAQPLSFAIAQQEGLELDVPVDGAVRIDLQVERREPLTGGGAEPTLGGPGPEGRAATSDDAADGGGGES